MLGKSGKAIQVIVLVAILLGANAFLGYSLAQESERAMAEQAQGRMLDLASSAAALLDGDVLGAFTAEDQGSPEYQRAKDTLSAFQENTDVKFVYCMRKVGDQSFEFTIDPAPDNPAAFGEAVNYTEALGKAGDGTPSVDLVAYEDRWGRFYSAYCPVRDSKGNVVSVVGVDLEAAWFEGHMASINRMIIINGFASLILAIIAVLVATRMSRAETEHVESLKNANLYDTLTGLPNMGHFLEHADERFDELVARGKDPAMLYVNLVGMKFFNQKYGFAAGSDLIESFAKLIAERFGQEHCSRFGQDHFVAMTDAEGLDARLDAFIEDCASVNNGNNVPVRIGVYLNSFGPEVDASVACDRAKMASEADEAGYRSSYNYFNEELMATIERRQYILDNFDRALDEEWIEVYYQPIVRTSTGKVCDEEALARWIDPDRGMLQPTEFVPVLEHAKLVYKLDLYVLEHMLEKMQRMADEGLYVVASSVNLSRSDFEVCDIVEEVRSRVDASAIGRDKVNVEITESALGSDFDFMKEQIGRFHDLGFQVWMDDFGSEYSSLDYLQSLQFDLMKLDMRFMQQFDNGDRSKIILTELVKMALALGIETVAEGVETQEQVDFLRRVGCTKMQGFYFTKPNSFATILERYETGTAIGMENPIESDYYTALGRANLYDLSSITRDDEDGLGEYFDTIPMAVVECYDEGFSVLRCNKPYYRFIDKVIGDDRIGVVLPFAQVDADGNSAFAHAIRECSQKGGRMTIDEVMPDGSTVHAFVRHIANNPVTGASALAVAVLAIMKD